MSDMTKTIKREILKTKAKGEYEIEVLKHGDGRYQVYVQSFFDKPDKSYLVKTEKTALAKAKKLKRKLARA